MPRAFTMTSAHMDAFSKQQRDRFSEDMFVYLKRSYPTKSAKLGDKTLRELIDEGISKARGYLMFRERDVARYIDFMMSISPDFDESEKTPWAKPILTDFELLAPEKLDRIEEHLIFMPPADASQ